VAMDKKRPGLRVVRHASLCVDVNNQSVEARLTIIIGSLWVWECHSRFRESSSKQIHINLRDLLEGL